MRISMIRAAIPLSMAALLAAGAAADRREEAEQYRGGAERTGSYDVRPMRAFGGLQWRFMTGGAVRSTPAGAGFVRIWAERAAPPDPGMIQGAAEYRPAPGPAER